MRKGADGHSYVVPSCDICRQYIRKIERAKALSPERLEEVLHESKMRTKLLNLVKNESDIQPKHLVRKMRIRIYNYHKLLITRKEKRYAIRNAKEKQKADRIAREQAETK